MYIYMYLEADGEDGEAVLGEGEVRDAQEAVPDDDPPVAQSLRGCVRGSGCRLRG